MRKQITSPHAPAAVGPYSQAIETSELVFISGQLPIDGTTNTMDDDVVKQAEQCFENLAHICNQANVQLTNAIKVTVLLANIDDFKAVNEVYATFFTEPYPARIAYQVGNLPLGAKVEIDAIISK